MPDSPWYNPALSFILLIELAYNLSLLVFAVLLLLLLFSRRSSFPLLMKAYLAYNAGFLLLETLAIDSLNLLTSSEINEAYIQLVRAIVSAAVWIPYFTVSKRVKGTFTVRQNLQQPVQRMISMNKKGKNGYHLKGSRS